MEVQVFERALEECGYDLDAVNKSLLKLSLVSDGDPGSFQELGVERIEGEMTNTREAVAALENPLAPDNIPSGAEWVELLLGELGNATCIDDAKARTSRVLEILEKSISARVGEAAAHSFHKERMTLKQQMEVLSKDNSFLKHFVAAQHERQKHLKEMISQYQEKLRTLEVNNYALTMYLNQTKQSSSIGGRFHPDIL